MAVPVKRALQVLALALVALLFALLIWKVVHQPGGGAAAQLAKGRSPVAPGFSLKRLDRPGTISLASLRGKAVVLNFWASWCNPCKQEAGRLESAWRRFAGRGVVFVGVDAQDFSSEAKRFARHYGLTYPMVHDGAGSTLNGYGVTGFPETFFVDRRGRLVGEHVDGPVTTEQLEQNIRLALSR
jgi:cytochrome c biogenesis protein CcmG/thiol:disulfide interchange protein DsbE